MSLLAAKVARQQVVLERLPQELGDVPNIQSAHQIEPMDFDRSDADVQGCGDLTIRVTQRDQSENLALTRRNLWRRFGPVFHSLN